MKVIGLLTEDSRLFYDLVVALKNENLPFMSLTFSDAVPANVGVVITTRGERPKVNFPIVVEVDDSIGLAIHLARKALSGKDRFQRVIVGIDPGKRPGFAVVGDEMVLHRTQADGPEDVLRLVEIAALMYTAEKLVIRIGNGSPTDRNRIIEAIAPLGLPTEVVDERRTTKRTPAPDIEAAIKIAFSEGGGPPGNSKVEPTDGELKDIQRLSRIGSRGELTIGRKLARDVACGVLSLEDAIERARKRRT